MPVLGDPAGVPQVILKYLVYGTLPLPPVFLYKGGKLLTRLTVARNGVLYSIVQNGISVDCCKVGAGILVAQALRSGAEADPWGERAQPGVAVPQGI